MLGLALQNARSHHTWNARRGAQMKRKSSRCRFSAILSLISIGLVGCATYSWKPGPTAVGSYEEASGKCSTVAKSGASGFYAQGSPGYVAGAAMGAAIGEAARQQSSFNDC